MHDVQTLFDHFHEVSYLDHAIYNQLVMRDDLMLSIILILIAAKRLMLPAHTQISLIEAAYATCPVQIRFNLTIEVISKDWINHIHIKSCIQLYISLQLKKILS